jgi:predicted nucleotidyltransferase component of viral defense system
MLGLAPQTLDIFPIISSLQCIKGFHLVGGTALSLQINHRLSEDLDFCRWVDEESAANGIDYKQIQEELDQVSKGVKVNALTFNYTEFFVNKVKITFFNEVGFTKPNFEPVDKGGIPCVPVDVLFAMKIKTMFERSKFRDYYDVYSIVYEKLIDLPAGIQLALEYDKNLNKAAVIKRLKSYKPFKFESFFPHLSPKYDVSPKHIGEFFEYHLKNF